MKTEAEKQKMLNNAVKIMRLQGNKPVILQTDTMFLFQLIGQLQLAFRHPHNVSVSRINTENFVRDLIDRIAPDDDALREILLLGFREDFVM